MVSSLGMAAPVTSPNNVLINQIMAVLEPAFCGTARTAAQTHTATYWATPELQPEAEIMQHFLSQFFWSENEIIILEVEEGTMRHGPW